MADRPPQRRAPQQKGAFVLTLSVLTAIFFLLGVAMLWLAVQTGLRLTPTPTPTATVRATYTPSPDARATHITEDMLTQVAVAATLVSRLTAAPPLVATPGAIPTTASTVVVQLPLVATDNGQPPSPLTTPNGGGPPTQAPAVTATANYLPNISGGQPLSPLPTPGLPPPPPPPPFGSPTPFLPPTPIPTVATAIPPTPVPTPIPPTATPAVATPTYVPVSQLAAALRTDRNPYSLRIGPSNVYSVAGTLPAGATIQLNGRTAAGDWVRACCLPDNVSAWVRTAYVSIANNTFPAYATATPGVNPNDPSWLMTLGIDPNLTPRPATTPIPYTDFPLPRYDSGNTGRVPQLPLPPLQSAWGNNPQSAMAFISPIGVRDQSVVVVNSDSHLYSLFANGGNQRWKFQLSVPTLPTLAPALQDDLIYLAAGNTILAVRDQGGSAELAWSGALDGDATTPFTVWQDALFIGVVTGGDHKLVALRRFNNPDRRTFDAPNAPVQLPAFGQEMVFVGADRLWAIDVNVWDGIETIWTSADVFNVAAPPVYSYPGVVRPAELYAADSGGYVHAIDANTGTRFFGGPFFTGGPVTALAVNETYLFIAGNNQLQALGRNDFQRRWQQPISGLVRGGPFVTAERVLVVLEGGGIQIFDAVTGTPLSGGTTPGVPVPAGPAVGGGVLFVPGNSNSVYAFRGP